MRTFVKAFILIIVCVLIVESSRAMELYKFNDLYIETEKYKVLGATRHMALEGGVPQYGLNLGTKFTFFDEYMYNDAKISSLTDGNQFRFVSLDTETGFDFGRLQIYFRHFSGHQLDRGWVDIYRFPEENAVGLRIYLLKQ